MKILTRKATLLCAHKLGVVARHASQRTVFIEGSPVMVHGDPAGRNITGCPNVGLTIKPCQRSLAVQEGYSSLVYINGQAVCLDSVTGLTDGTPPGMVIYQVRSPGQDFVSSEG